MFTQAVHPTSRHDMRTHLDSDFGLSWPVLRVMAAPLLRGMAVSSSARTGSATLMPRPSNSPTFQGETVLAAPPTSWAWKQPMHPCGNPMLELSFFLVLSCISWSSLATYSGNQKPERQPYTTSTTLLNGNFTVCRAPQGRNVYAQCIEWAPPMLYTYALPNMCA